MTSPLGPREVVQLVRELSLEAGAVLVGGQAIGFWHWYYCTVTDRDSDKLLTSKDIDYVGSRATARAFAEAVGGELTLPLPDDATPNTAIVYAEMNGKRILIDFLSGILGVRPSKLRASKLLIELLDDGGVKTVEIPLLHPVLCLISRVVNILHPATKRTDPFGIGQFEAAYEIIFRHLDEGLREADYSDFHYCTRHICDFLCSDEYGRVAYLELPENVRSTCDLINVLRAYINDDRVDARYREFTLQPMIRKIESRRAGIEARRERARAHQVSSGRW